MGSPSAWGAKMPQVYGELGLGGLPVWGGEAEWVPGPGLACTPLTDPCGYWQGGVGWAGWSPQSHETRLLPTWPGGPYQRIPGDRDLYLPCCSWPPMAPQLPIGCWPEDTPLPIATAPLPVTSAQDAFLFGSKTHTPPWLPGLPLPAHVPGRARNTARSGALPGGGSQQTA